MKKLQVPYNLDTNVLTLYENWSEYIYEIYFPLHPDIFPSARQNDFPSLKEYNLSMFKLIERMKTCNIKTMCLLNGTKVNYSQEILNGLFDNLKELSAIGLDGVIVADPILAEWVNINFPELKIRLSVLSNICDLAKIKEIESIGYIKEICLPQNVNRNEDLLKILKEETSISYSTIVNSLCRINCPLFYWHQNLYNSTSCNWFSEDNREIRESFLNLTTKFSQNYLKAPFILPSELSYYKKYFNHFKLEDRTLPTSRLMGILEHYALEQNPKYLECCISGSCIYTDPNMTTEFPKEWREYIRNCKGECWHCSYCDKIMEDKRLCTKSVM